MRFSQQKGFQQLAVQTLVAYVRMASTVVIAVVVRLCLDCFGIIFTDQEPEENYFWFAHCHKRGTCVLTGISLFFMSLVACSAFAWSCQEWIMDPARNRFARSFSFAIIVEAAVWVPISVVVGKTNAVVEWFMDITEDDITQALLSSAVSLLITISCALVTHVIMTYCGNVQKSAVVKEAGLAGFFKFFLLATLYCLGWAVGWSNWELVLALMDALEPGRSVHNVILAVGVISSFLIFCTCFYLTYGPEPIIPDPQLQQMCYNHGYSRTVWRSLVSYVVYSCVVFIVMCCSDPTYGILFVLARMVYASSSTAFDSYIDAKALIVLCILAVGVTLLSALCSAAITWANEVDESSSSKFSRSVQDACTQMVTRKRSSFDTELMQVFADRSDLRFLEAAEGSPRDRWQSQSPVNRFRLPSDEEGDGSVSDADESAGPSVSECDYVDASLLSDGEANLEDLLSERQLHLSPQSLSRAKCASVLIYDVLGLVVCFAWGGIAVRWYSILFGHLAGQHDALYALSCVLYAVVVIISLAKFVFVCFPSVEEIDIREEARSIGHKIPSLVSFAADGA